MQKLLKNAALTAALAAAALSGNNALADEVSSIRNAKPMETMYVAGNVLNGHDIKNTTYAEPLLLDADTMRYINLTDFYDEPRPILAKYKEDAGYPVEVDINIDDKHHQILDDFMDSDANTVLSRDDIKEFLVLREVSKEFCLMYETGEELLNMAGSYDSLENENKGLLHKNETIVNGTALVLFAKSEMKDNPVIGTRKVNTLISLLGNLENELSSSPDVLKEIGVDVTLSYLDQKNGEPGEHLQENNIRRIANILTWDHKDVGKQYHAELVAKENAGSNMVATMSF